jgi:hypothetical protein
MTLRRFFTGSRLPGGNHVDAGSRGATSRPGLATVAVAGAVGGLYGAAAMSVLPLGLTEPVSSTRWSLKRSKSGCPTG